MAIDIFQSLKNCVFDLQRADVQNYQQPLKQLARLLNSENLQSVNAHLTRNVELDTFLARSEDTNPAWLVPLFYSGLMSPLIFWA